MKLDFLGPSLENGEWGCILNGTPCMYIYRVPSWNLKKSYFRVAFRMDHPVYWFLTWIYCQNLWILRYRGLILNQIQFEGAAKWWNMANSVSLTVQELSITDLLMRKQKFSPSDMRPAKISILEFITFVSGITISHWSSGVVNPNVFA